MVVIETMRTQARVTVLSLVQPRLADGAIQAPMVHTAEELDVAALSSPGDLTVLSLRTVAAVGRSPVLTPASVLTRLTLTLVDVDLTQLTCRKTPGSGGHVKNKQRSFIRVADVPLDRERHPRNTRPGRCVLRFLEASP